MADVQAWRQQAEEVSREFGEQAQRVAEQARERLERLMPEGGAGAAARWATFGLAAFGLGFLAGILAAPRRGEETRAIVKDKAAEYSKDISDRVAGRISRIAS